MVFNRRGEGMGGMYKIACRVHVHSYVYPDKRPQNVCGLRKSGQLSILKFTSSQGSNIFPKTL